MAIKLLISVLLSSCFLIVLAANPVSVTVTDGRVTVTTPGGRKQVFSAKSASSNADVKLIDLTFSGKKDLMILRDRGANQEFYDVYLYSRKYDEFIYNKQLSGIPCPGADVKNKELIGRCFRGGTCEHWEEYYSVASNGKISMRKKSGVYCDITTGKGYRYVDQFRNGRRISSSVTPIEDGSND